MTQTHSQPHTKRVCGTTSGGFRSVARKRFGGRAVRRSANRFERFISQATGIAGGMTCSSWASTSSVIMRILRALASRLPHLSVYLLWDAARHGPCVKYRADRASVSMGRPAFVCPQTRWTATGQAGVIWRYL